MEIGKMKKKEIEKMKFSSAAFMLKQSVKQDHQK